MYIDSINIVLMSRLTLILIWRKFYEAFDSYNKYEQQTHVNNKQMPIRNLVDAMKYLY